MKTAGLLFGIGFGFVLGWSRVEHGADGRLNSST